MKKRAVVSAPPVAVEEARVEWWWQVIVGVFFVLLPLVLMLDFWGDERLTSEGKPIQRDWFRQIEHEDLEAAASHGEMIGVAGGPDVEDSHGVPDGDDARDAPHGHAGAEGGEDDPADVASH